MFNLEDARVCLDFEKSEDFRDPEQLVLYNRIGELLKTLNKVQQTPCFRLVRAHRLGISYEAFLYIIQGRSFHDESVYKERLPIKLSSVCKECILFLSNLVNNCL